MPRKAKIGNPQGVSEWTNLETMADVKRHLAWCIHSVRDQTLDPRTAATLGQLCCYLIKAIEGADLETKIQTLAEKYQRLRAELEEKRDETVFFRPR